MKVTLFQYRLFHYRLRLFELMRQKCTQAGIELNIVYGQPYGDEIKKKDTGELPWGIKVKSRYFPIKEKKDLCWQPAPAAVRDSDLFVFMHENRLLANYWWLLRRSLGMGPRVAFWGHGRDFQSYAPNGLREKWKRMTLNWPDWWFGYTSLTRRIVEAAGFPSKRITVVNNAIDNEEFVAELAAVTDADIVSLLGETGFAPSDFVAIYCGSLYKEKRIEQLLAIAERIHEQQPAFRLLIVGDGAQRSEVEQHAASRPWIAYLGAVHGARKAACFKLARVLLCPGAVGLNILDSFIAGTPLLTMKSAMHGPEIGFLEHSQNGYLINDSDDEYVAQVDQLISQPAELARVRHGALLAANEYTVDRMAERFVEGLRAALADRRQEQPA
ncbi:Glycosyltransferase involved in cell wall bisynthesis [Andreprevotia lacus DSM 23236]|jgi:glycosyltransferase involved in cell wall biosynthesis|uniref:Glycosyltransferase involved in cell wall bisynthesis n=1 Tax=Andreprevotia lacus DSM 23236 TaxID=1121001 RepID=A0A1W1XHS6_9NEIS|nr:glycosyltransferase family 4 protein [Andreprevotia lacus]SMC23061.1 Glycosyltransferase involved in cell wall bisynthesis [Andreprevotia lacus DSM 23236]